jgi:predicted amidophosphoribosyltransferase
MALNLLTFTEKVVGAFLKYSSPYPFTDPKLHEQMRSLLSLAATRDSAPQGAVHQPLPGLPKVLLFDDLFRSGATMNAITAALYDQGGREALRTYTP